jgi:hypothetical protein
MRARNNLIARGILSAIVVVFLTMQLTPGIYAEQALARNLIVNHKTGVVYQLYYGQIHCHTKDSDGGRPTSEPGGTPYDAYLYARDTAGLDFFSVADHCSYPYDPVDPLNPYGNDGLTVEEYNSLKEVADSFNVDGQFVTFWGFEWTSDTTDWGGPLTLLGKGHITIINSPDHCEADEPPTNDLKGLMAWMSNPKRKNCLAFFNHPGQYDTNFDYFLGYFSDKIIGMETWNRKDDYYADIQGIHPDGFWYNDALSKGWYIGAEGSGDNHYRDWGTQNEWRMAVLAKHNTRKAIYEAMKARRFYSTRDKNLVLSFTCNGAQMGSKIKVKGGPLDVMIEASDGDGEVFSRICLLKNGKEIQNWNPNSTNPHVTTTVNGTEGDYFYVLVEQSGELGWRAISSPIFIDKHKK